MLDMVIKYVITVHNIHIFNNVLFRSTIMNDSDIKEIV